MALMVGATAAAAQTTSNPIPGTVLLETIDVDTQGAQGSNNPPSFAAQAYRFMRRPGAETVVSVTEQDPGVRGNLRSVLNEVPGVYIPERNAGTEGLISIRGTDIAGNGPRSGRGIRTYIDGVPLGRTDAGITNAFLDPLPADYIEVYRGANSLRYGTISTGGAFNIVSKTGLNFTGTQVGTTVGTNRYMHSFIENGGTAGSFDWFIHQSYFFNDGFQEHTREQNTRFNANVGWRPTKNVESRTYVAFGRADVDLANTVPLNRLEALGRSADALALRSDTDRNFDYARLANRTTFRFDNSSIEVAAYYLNTVLDHLPTPFSGIVDHTWLDYGASVRLEHKTSLFSLPTEIVAGARVNYTDGDFLRWRWTNNGKSKGLKVGDWDFASWLVEGYGETAVEVLPRVKLFTGLQWAYTTRELVDQYTGGTLAAVGANVITGPQPGRSGGKQDYDRDFETLNPKVGANWEHTKGHFVFANVARSYEVPVSGDLSDRAAVETQIGRKLPNLEAQEAWTQEVGVRGGWDRFQYDITLYHMTLENEILTRCATEVSATCSTVVAFNATNTVHNGIELGLKTIPFQNVVHAGDQIYLNGVWNYTDFYFDNDPTFGNKRLPVIPEHQVYGELGYRTASGFFMSANLRHLSERLTTYDHSGGSAYVVPDHVLYGAKVGFKPVDGSWSVFVEGRNLTDEVFVADFTATPTRPRTATGALQDSPLVRQGDGRAFYTGFTFKF